MSDTTFEMDEKMREMMRMKSPIERLEMGCSMMAASRQLIIRFILEENPGISKTRLKQELFLKLYRDDFSLEEQEKILKHFEACTQD